jgi:hypothetical protein
MLKRVRRTLALRFVRPDDNTVAVREPLLGRLDTLGLRVKRLFLDTGFAGTAVLAYLSKRKQPTLIACPIRGKHGGTRAVCQGQRSSRTSYTFKEGSAEAFTAELAVCRTLTSCKRTQRRARRATWLLSMLIKLELPPKRVRRLYRKRFGVESSYRCAGQVRGWTTSRTAAYRCVLLGLSFILLNAWLLLRWCFTHVPRPGGHALATHRFAWSRFVALLRRALECHYGVVHAIAASGKPRL